MGSKTFYQLLTIFIVIVGSRAQLNLPNFPKNPNLTELQNLPDFPSLPNLANLPGARTLINKLINSGKSFLLPLLKKELNFGDIGKGLKIMLNGKQLNSFKFSLDLHELAEIADHLFGFSLDDRMKAWGLMAKYANLFQGALKEFDIKDLRVFEGDIILSVNDLENLIEEGERVLKQMSSSAGVPRRKKRKISLIPSEKWDLSINWYLDEKLFTKSQNTMIKDALDYWERETCLSFVRHTSKPAGDHIFFVNQPGCSSEIGRKKGGQYIELGDGCFDFGTVVHEIGHALGMWHEQSRPDRDLYINIDAKNVKQNRIDQFQERTWDNADTEAIPYDYGSVMQYGRKFFSWNSRDTLVPKNFGYEQTMGQVIKASFHDIKVINFRYCKRQCGPTLETNICENDGYLDPRNCKKCKCPDGFKPPYCRQLKDHTIASCGPNDLPAMARWSTLSSPGFPSLTAKGECFWRITAPRGSRVELQFVDGFRLPPPPFDDACSDYIEVRYKDLALTGPRFCGVNKPFKPLVSETESMVLLFRSKSKSMGNTGFRVKFRLAHCGGCTGSGGNTQPACLETYRYTCQGQFKCNWLGRTKCFRANTCLRSVSTCCSGFRLIAKNKTCTKI